MDTFITVELVKVIVRKTLRFYNEFLAAMTDLCILFTLQVDAVAKPSWMEP